MNDLGFMPSWNGLIAFAAVLLGLAAVSFLLGRYVRARSAAAPPELSPVTRQHLDFYQGGQLNQAEVEATKRRFRRWLEMGMVDRVSASFRDGTQYIFRVRALAEIGTEEACQILENQLDRQITSNQLDQAWYWIDLASSLRHLNREQSLPRLLACVPTTDDYPLVQYFAAEIVSFLSFGGYVKQMDTPAGRAALRALHRALEGLRFGVPPQILAEARLGEVVEMVWDARPEHPDPLVLRILGEVRRTLRRRSQMEQLLLDDPFEHEAFQLQLSRLDSLGPAIEEYLGEAGPAVVGDILATEGLERRDVLWAIHDLRLEAGKEILAVLRRGDDASAEVAALCLRWSRDQAVGPFLREWTGRHVPLAKRAQKRRAVLPPLGTGINPKFPYRAVLFALRGHPSPETEQFLLTAARDFDPGFRSTAVGSLGWWTPFASSEVLLHLNAARFDPSPDVRHAARASLARLGERQALQWFRQALSSDNRQRVLEAIQTIVIENLTLLWPDLDRIADGDDTDLVHCAREGLEQMQEEFDNGWGR